VCPLMAFGVTVPMQHRNLDFPLLAGFVLSREATVAIGSKMDLRARPVRRRHAWSDLLELAHQIAANPGADGTLQALEKLPKSENLSKEEGSNVAAASTGALD
jgi:hypothetical protein